MITLALDASTYEGTVAVLDGTKIVSEGQAIMRGRDAERLMPEVEATLKRGGVSAAEVDRIVCGAGPGSFTSLRIAGSIAKGVALGAGKHLYAVSSLALIVAGNATQPGRFLALLDAMREEYFGAVFSFDGVNVNAVTGQFLTPKDTINSMAAKFDARAVGPDFGDQWKPHARGVRQLATVVYSTGPVNLADWEPSYGRLAEAQVKLEATVR